MVRNVLKVAQHTLTFDSQYSQCMSVAECGRAMFRHRIQGRSPRVYMFKFGGPVRK